jgi:hypothetical protein
MAELYDHLDGLFEWLRAERGYQVAKFGQEADLEHVREGAGEDTWLEQQIWNYLGRVRLFGLDNPQGRQAYMKLVATLVGLGEAVVAEHGWPPGPGVSSGTLVPSWEPEGWAARAWKAARSAEPCRVPGAAERGVCGYAGPDGSSACREECIYRG